MHNHAHVAASLIDAESRLSRSRLWRLFAAALGAVIGLGRASGAGACRKNSARCDRSNQCCSNRCRRGFCYPREKRKKKR